MPTFVQFGQDYAGARDQYVYLYAIRLKDSSDLKVQKPGEIDLFRVDKDHLMQQGAYEFFAGLDGQGNATWTSNLSARSPVFQDAAGVGWNVSVSYNEGIGRYLLCTEHQASFQGSLGIFDAPGCARALGALDHGGVCFELAGIRIDVFLELCE